MQITQRTETRLPLIWDTKLEVIPGGVTVAIADLTQTVLYAGTPLGRDSNNLYHVIKGAVAYAAASNTATAYQVKKGHNFKIGDFYGRDINGNAYAITGIDITNPLFDTITLGTTLGITINVGEIFIQAKASGANAALYLEPAGYVGTHTDIIVGGNLLVDCVVRGSMRNAALVSLGIPVNAGIMAKTPLVRLSF